MAVPTQRRFNRPYRFGPIRPERRIREITAVGLFFMHFWANDDVANLTHGLRAALDLANVKHGSP
jgi:hypothetical protein